MKKSDGQTKGAAATAAETTMRDNEASTNREQNRVEPILDASGTLRRHVLRKLGAERAEHAGDDTAHVVTRYPR